MRMTSVRRLLLSAGLVAWLVAAPTAAWAGYLSEAGLGTASMLSTFIYGPIKLTYAILGGTIGGLSYLLSVGNLDVANKIWVPSLGGNYVITPEMLKGEQAIHFFGSSTMASGSTEAGY
ncbi:MAG TPA: hypothetical protein VEI24_01470 [Nitrospiria bacterium]|nr:hypothetical protein [Nitrospiria bacterium]